MSDLDIGWAVNDQDALDSLDNIEKKGGKTASFMDKEFESAATKLRKTFIGIGNIGQAAMLGIGGATAYGVKAVRDYAKYSDAGAASIAAFDDAVSLMSVNVGRDLQGVVGVFTDLVDMVEQARQSTVNWLAGQNGAANDQARKAEEMQTRMIRGAETRDTMLRQFRLQKARSQDDPMEAARVEAENLRRDTMTKLNADKNMSQNDKAAVIAAMEDSITRMMQDAALEMDKRTREVEAQLIAQERVTNGEREQFDMSADQLRIDNLRLDGQNKLADTMEIQLEFAKRRRDIERSSLSADEKKVRLEELAGLEQFQLAHLKEKMGSITTSQIQSGLLGGAALQALVFGGNKTKAQETLEKIGYDQVKLLGRIAEGVERDQVTVLA